jgi:hypothetical protein
MLARAVQDAFLSRAVCARRHVSVLER